MDQNEFLYAPSETAPGAPCALGTLRDGLCRYGGFPPQSHPFVQRQHLYLTSACSARMRWSPWQIANDRHGSLAGRAMHRKIHLTWSLDAEVAAATRSIEVLYGQAGARESLLEAALPRTIKHQLLPWMTLRACQFQQRRLAAVAEENRRWRPAPACRNGGRRRVPTSASELWLHELRTQLTYRLELVLHRSDERAPVEIGPIFLRTE